MNCICSIVIFCVLAGLPLTAYSQPPRLADGELPGNGQVAWKLDVLNAEPVRIVRTSINEKKNQVTWILELTRDLDPFNETVVWQVSLLARNAPPFRFKLLDDDGVTLTTLESQYDGEFSDKKGHRFRVILQLPTDAWAKTKVVQAQFVNE